MRGGVRVRGGRWHEGEGWEDSLSLLDCCPLCHSLASVRMARYVCVAALKNASQLSWCLLCLHS